MLFSLALGLHCQPLAVLGVVAWEVLYLSVALEHQQMINHLVHEISVVAHYNNTSGEVGKIFLQYLKCHDVKVVGRFVEHEEVGILHEHCTQIQFAPFTTAQLIYIIMLLFGGKEEILQELRC